MAMRLSLPQDLVLANRYKLRSDIPALELNVIEEGVAIAGPLLRLPSGVELEGFGQYLDARSLLVRFDGKLHVVFQEDLDSAKMLELAKSA